MNFLVIVTLVTTLLFVPAHVSAGTWVFSGGAGASNCGEDGYWDVYGVCDAWGGSVGNLYMVAGSTYTISHSIHGSADLDECGYCCGGCTAGNTSGSWLVAETVAGSVGHCTGHGTGGAHHTVDYDSVYPTWLNPEILYRVAFTGGRCCDCSGSGVIIVSNDTTHYTVSGVIDCANMVELYAYSGEDYYYVDQTTAPSYSFDIYKGVSYRLLFNGIYYDFVCDGNEVFDYDACNYVYGYTCGVDSVRLYKDVGGWVIDEVESQDVGYDVYEIKISYGTDYLISFVENGFIVHNQTFSCTGNDVNINHDRCVYVNPPSPSDDPYIIHLWVGYDYNIIVFRDEHGNFVENAQLAIYDKTDGRYIQRWAHNGDGYTLLGARFDTDHDISLSLRTFDGVFVLDATFPANGSAIVGEEDIIITNWTIPIKYNLKLYPTTLSGKPVFGVFCGLSEYTPIHPGTFWGMDLNAAGYVPISNCSGFAMCDIIAEKPGYSPYDETAYKWASRTAMAKDYRYNIVMEEK